MKKYDLLYRAVVRMRTRTRTKTAADVAEAGRKAWHLWGRLAEEVAPSAVKAAPAAGTAYLGYKGYKKGKEKLEQRRLMKRVEQARKQQMKFGATKEAGPLGALRGAAKATGQFFKEYPAAGFAAVPVVAAGATALVEGIRRSYYAARKGHDFKQMIEANPDFKRRDDQSVRRAFGALHRLNPSFAREPLVAGAWVRHALDSSIGETGMSINPQSAALVSNAYKGRASPSQAAASAIAPSMTGALRVQHVRQKGAPRYDDPDEVNASLYKGAAEDWSSQQQGQQAHEKEFQGKMHEGLGKVWGK